MSRNKEFDNALNECLERLLTEGETLEQCLESYPEQANELKPLLQTALIAQKASVIQPRPEFKAGARYQFRSALQEAALPKSRLLFRWKPQWATVVITVLVLILAGGGGTVAAAGNSMPDEPLYPVKLATEQARLALTPSDIGKAQFAAELADKRINEIIYLANKGESQQITQTAQRLASHLTRVAVLAETETDEVAEEEPSVMLAPAPEEESGATLAPTPAPAPRAQTEHGKGNGGSPPAHPVQNSRRANLRITVTRYEATHLEELHAALETAPESVKPALRRAITVSAAAYEKALKNLD